MFKLCICVSLFFFSMIPSYPFFSVNKAIGPDSLDTRAFIYFIHDASIFLRILHELASVKVYTAFCFLFVVKKVEP